MARGPSKNPRRPGEGPVGLRWSVRLAPVPPCSSVLPPGAGNEEADEGRQDRRGASEEGRGANRPRGPASFKRHLHAPAVRRDDDGDVAAIVPIEQTQAGLPNATRPTRAVRAVYEALRDRATTRTPRHRTCRHEASAVGEARIGTGSGRSRSSGRRTRRDRRSPDGLVAIWVDPPERAGHLTQRCPASRTSAELARAERASSTRKA